MSFPLFPKTPGRDSIMWMSYLAICLLRRIKTKPIDGRSANKRMVGRKLEMTLAGKSRFWYQIAPGALRPGFMPILVLQSSWWGRESWLLCLVCLPGVSWWLCGSSSRCHVAIVIFSDHTYLLFMIKFGAWSGSKLFEPVPSKHLLY